MARTLSRLPIAWSDDVVNDAQLPSCQDKPHQLKPNRIEPNRIESNEGCSSRHWEPAINLEIRR